MSYNIGCVQGVGSRPYQEDSYGFVNAGDVTLIKQYGLFAVVADGIGGLRNGKEASTLALNVLRTDFMRYDRKVHLGMQLAQSIHRANDQVYQAYQQESGSTVVAAILYQEKLYFASVGDSTIWLVRKNEVIRLNEPQNLRFRLYLETIRNNSADPDEGRNDPQEHSLTEYVGSETIHAVDMNYRPLSLKNEDVIILCSDGIGDVLTDQEVLYCLAGGRNANQACAMMDSLISNKKRRGQDNYTAVMIRCLT